MQKIIFSLLLTFVFTSLYGQNDRQDYIEKYKATAVQKMREHGIPASITLAQGILESGAGNSKLTVNANNHFGIKCHNEWRGKTFTMDDDEKNKYELQTLAK